MLLYSGMNPFPNLYRASFSTNMGMSTNRNVSMTLQNTVQHVGFNLFSLTAFLSKNIRLSEPYVACAKTGRMPACHAKLAGYF